MIFADIAAFLLLGNAFSCSACCRRVPKGVVIDGVDVGGLTLSHAEEVLKGELLKRLSPVVVHAPKGDLVLDEELVLKCDVRKTLENAKRGEEYTLSYTRECPDLENILYNFCKENAKEARDAELSFSEKGFFFRSHTIGVYCDFDGLLKNVLKILPTGGEVSLSFQNYSPQVTLLTLKERTKLLSSYTTYFDAGNVPRSKNIALAAEKISGTILGPGEEFSFNAVVGERTEENGFGFASVIFDGEYVPGVGGGVCQASSTLFCCALKGGMQVVESHPHSLPIGYVPPSLDAMVSSVCDLKFVNPYPFPVYLLGESSLGSVHFSMYGAPDGNKYETESVILSKIPPEEEEIVPGEKGILRKEKDGVLSESYLVVYDKEGTLLKRTRIRRDFYLPTRGKVGEIPEDEENLPQTEGQTEIKT